MNVHDYIKAAAVATMIALTAVGVVRHEQPAAAPVERVSEVVVMKPVEAAPSPPKEVIAPRHKRPAAKVEREHEHKAVKVAEHPAAKVEPHALAPWSLPWSCGKVKWAANTFSAATLESMRVTGGVAPLTSAQKQQARECIEGKRS